MTLAAGDLIAVDRASRAVFRVDASSGAQTLISQAARLLAPQGVAAARRASSWWRIRPAW